MKKTLLVLGMVVAFVGFMTLCAQATPSLDFGTGDAGSGGTLSLLTGGNVSGTNIPIDTLTVTGAGAANGVYDVDGTVTGSGESGVGSLNFNTTPGNNYITISGTINDNSTDNLLVTPSSGFLLSGTISSFTLVNSSTTFGISSATGIDTKDPALLSFLGIPGQQFSFFGFSTKGGPGGGAATSTDISNTGLPEPATLLLLGLGLFGLGLVGLKRRQKV